MKRIIFLFAISFLFVSQSVSIAQSHDKGGERWKKYQSEKIAFITSELDLTPDEAQKFWPVYNQLNKELREAQKNRHEMSDKLRETEESISDKKAKELTRKYALSRQSEANLAVKYNEEFLKILPPLKVLKLYKVENEFRLYLIKKFRKNHKRGEK